MSASSWYFQAIPLHIITNFIYTLIVLLRLPLCFILLLNHAGSWIFYHHVRRSIQPSNPPKTNIFEAMFTSSSFQVSARGRVCTIRVCELSHPGRTLARMTQLSSIRLVGLPYRCEPSVGDFRILREVPNKYFEPFLV
jgi:hypothetical protein